MSRQHGSHRRLVARQQRASRWMSVVVAVLGTSLLVLALLAAKQYGLGAFLSGGG